MIVTKHDDYEGSPAVVREQLLYCLECIARGDRIKDLPMSSALFYRALLQNPDLQDAYKIAQLARADLYADRAVGVAEDDSQDMTPDGKPNGVAVSRAALKVKTYSWMASILAPRRYGRQVDATDDGEKRASRLVIESSADALQRARTVDNGDAV